MRISNEKKFFHKSDSKKLKLKKNLKLKWRGWKRYWRYVHIHTVQHTECPTLRINGLLDSLVNLKVSLLTLRMVYLAPFYPVWYKFIEKIYSSFYDNLYIMFLICVTFCVLAATSRHRTEGLVLVYDCNQSCFT